MSKRILFLYFTKKDKENLLLCEKVIRAALHKFRKGALFSYVQLDTSPSCRERMHEILVSEAAYKDAIFVRTDRSMASSCNDLLKEVFGVTATEHCAAGRIIIYPENDTLTEDTSDCIKSTSVCSKENIITATSLALDCAKRCKHSLTVCIQAESHFDKLFLRETEYALSKEKHIPAECVSLDETLQRCVKSVPDFDVVLTAKEYAPFIVTHLNSMTDIPYGYVILHGDNAKIYRRQILPSEEIGSISLASSLLAVSQILETEFAMKNAAAWFRSAIALSVKSDIYNSDDSLANIIIDHINRPIRKRRTEKNENQT